MKSIIKFFKDRIVFTVSLFLAIFSCFFVKPSLEYLSYIDINTLCILFALMATIQGFNGCGIFRKLGQFLCSKCHSIKSLSIILVMLCFFTSMFITNDVALLTFVPFAIILFNEIDNTPTWVTMFTVILMTVAANTGSMLTPVGNPQNLFIYEKSGMHLGKFILILLPYTGICFFMLIASSLFVPSIAINFKSNTPVSEIKTEPTQGSVVYAVKKESNKNAIEISCKKRSFLIFIYSLLFIVCLLSVCRIIPKTVASIITLIVLLIFDRKTLLKVDYILLLTFICFFIFSGNLSNIQNIKTFLQSVLNNKECITGALASQVVSNVPATLMLYPFTENISELLLGVNFGGLGTLVGSLASLISFNIYSQESHRIKSSEKSLPSQGKYLLYFTIINVVYILILFGAKALISLI